MLIRFFFFLLITTLLYSCTTSKSAYSPSKKIAATALKKDFFLLRKTLEAKHPSLYWYTPKQKMDQYFDSYYAKITDSMTEQQFAWLIVAPVIDKIKCGHTSVSLSKQYDKWIKGKYIATFPLFLKVWNDTLAVTGNYNFKKDSIFKRGTLITAINGIPNQLLIKYMLDFLPSDGYAENVNYIRLSSNFPYYHRNIFGLSKNYEVAYIDSNGVAQKAMVPLFIPAPDSTKKDSTKKIITATPIKVNKLLKYRSFTIDSSKKFATLTINTFAEGHLRAFFRRSFRKIRKQHIQHLVIDVRNNGGGRVGLSTLLTRYVSKQKFKVADSLYATARGVGPYGKYITGGFLNSVEMLFISPFKKNGQYHIKHLENHWYTPKRKAFNGNVYVITSGPTFSAAALFCNVLKGQKDVTIVGEETGGGWYGNNGIIIPDVKLPNTGIRVRLPLYRLVQYNHPNVKGTGIMPDVYVPTSYEALLKGYDKKMAVVRSMIFSNTQP
ncbi:S41 family peptidase [Ferruginibacter yonginensis]|uniref:S41 family peptidase n=1 Tax=Ferruginibacter yonginensis TaxID=1310416 RepID=A0ABV8QSU9_9BACT